MRRAGTMALTFGATLLVASCKRASTTVTRDVPDTSASPSSAPTTNGPAPSKHALDGYPPPVDSDAPGCTLSGRWAWTQPRDLRFRPDAPAFARLGGGNKGAVTLLDGPKPNAYVELSSDSVELFAFVSEEISLHASKPFLFGGFVIPGTQARLVFHGGDAGKIDVSLDVGDALHPVKPARDVRRCDELSLDEVVFTARDAIPDPSEKMVALTGSARLPIRERVGGAAVAEIDPTKCAWLAGDVIAHTATDVRVIIEPCSLDPTVDYLVVGWIPASRTTPLSGGTGGSWGSGGGGGALHPRPPKRRRATCPHEVPLVAELSGERRLVGAIATKASFYVMDPVPGGLIGIVPAFELTTAENATWLVKEDVLTDCAME